LSKYEIRLTSKVQKSLAAITKKDRLRLLMAIELLSETPIPPAAKKLVDSRFYRVRVGDYRIIYTIDNGQLIVRLIQIAHRRAAYRNI